MVQCKTHLHSLIFVAAFGVGLLDKVEANRFRGIAAASTSTPDATSKVRSLIIGGENVPPGKYLGFAHPPAGPDEPICAGYLVRPDIVLSAAYCDGDFALGSMHIGGLYRDGSDENGENYTVVSELPHPAYNSSTLQNALMLLKLETPSDFTLAKLNFDPFVPKQNEIITAIGNGYTSTTGPPSYRLQEVQLDVISNSQCDSEYTTFSVESEYHWCAQRKGSGLCTGDGGSPAFAEDGSLIGILSFIRYTEDDEPSCADETDAPVGFTRISTHEDWIKESICSLSDAEPAPWCEVADPCNPNPCQNGGTCTAEGDKDSYMCNCRDGYEGTNCETEIVQDPCNPNPCQHFGTCTAWSDEEPYLCNCPDGYKGANCETEIVEDPCNPNPCQHFGTCTAGSDEVSYLCNCPDGYEGSNCETEIVEDPCNPNPCQNGGSCKAKGEQESSLYSCDCPDGYEGTDCETKVGDGNSCGIFILICLFADLIRSILAICGI